MSASSRWSEQPANGYRRARDTLGPPFPLGSFQGRTEATTPSPSEAKHGGSSSPDQRSTRTLRIALGAISVLLGLAALLWPGVTLLVVTMLFGLELIAAGLVRIAAAATLSALPGWQRATSGVLGALTVLAGIICFVRPGTSLPRHLQPPFQR